MHPPNGSTKRLRVAVTIEPESWVMKRVADEFICRASRSFECARVTPEEPLNDSYDAVFYVAWGHCLRQRLDVLRRLPCVVLTTHFDRFAFRFRLLACHSRMLIGCQSSQWLRYLRKWTVPHRKLRLTPLGVDLQEFQPMSIESEPGLIRVGVVGRLYPDGRKGEKMLIEIARLLPPGRFEFLITGDRWQPVLDILRANRVRLSYYQNIPRFDLRRCYNEMDCLLICSEREGGPIPALEALACGTPLVSRAVGYVPDLLEGRPYAGALFRSVEEACDHLLRSKEVKAATANHLPEIRKELEKYCWESFTASVGQAIREVAA